MVAEEPAQAFEIIRAPATMQFRIQIVLGLGGICGDELEACRRPVLHLPALGDGLPPLRRQGQELLAAQDLAILHPERGADGGDVLFAVRGQVLLDELRLLPPGETGAVLIGDGADQVRFGVVHLAHVGPPAPQANFPEALLSPGPVDDLVKSISLRMRPQDSDDLLALLSEAGQELGVDWPLLVLRARDAQVERDLEDLAARIGFQGCRG